MWDGRGQSYRDEHCVLCNEIFSLTTRIVCVLCESPTAHTEGCVGGVWGDLLSVSTVWVISGHRERRGAVKSGIIVGF